MSHGMRDFRRFSTSSSPCFWVDSSRWLKSLKPSSECQSLKTNRWNLKMGAPWKRRNMSQITQLFGGSMFVFQGVNWILLGRVTGDVLIAFCQCVWSLNSWYNLTRWCFKHVLFSSLPGEMIQFDYIICFRWVKTTNWRIIQVWNQADVFPYRVVPGGHYTRTWIDGRTLQSRIDGPNHFETTQTVSWQHSW